jgi:predicted nicotinamide N-methyase
MGNCREVEIAGKILQIWEHEAAVDEKTGEAEAGSWVWDCALVLAHWLDTPSWSYSSLSGKRVIELGAGTGLPGLVAAVLGADVILTDKKALLPGLERNVAANNLGDKVEVQELEWGLDCRHVSPPMDYVLMSDLLYDTKAMPALCKTLLDLSDAHTEILLAYELRAGTTECFKEFQRRGLRWSKVSNNDLHPDWNSEDIGVFKIQRVT